MSEENLENANNAAEYSASKITVLEGLEAAELHSSEELSSFRRNRRQAESRDKLA